MLLLLGLLPLALIGFALNDDDDDGNAGIVENGTEAADRISGVQGDDFIDGEGGDDILNGRAGNDTIFGRDGDDILQGQDGDDTLCSGDGDDVIFGNTGRDFIEGQGGDDFVSGDYAQDTVRGDEGDDTVIGGRGTDVVEGNDGDDLVFGGIVAGLPLTLDEADDLRDGDSLREVNGGIDIRDDRFGNAVRGGVGDDDLVIGSLDRVGGGVGQDTFHLMSEMTDDGAATIVDYNADDDAITVIVEDPDADTDINVSDDGDDALVRLGDRVLARVEGGAGQLTAADITLIAESAVETLFDPNSAAA